MIDSLDISFPGGLVIITGQTGAGKSILLGALSLVAGTKADASLIREGADSCVVEAEFDGIGDEVRPLLEAADAEWDDGHVIVRRTVNANGRSRCFVNDSPVQVSVLQSLSEHLFDIHSQHRSLLVTDRDFQLSILDAYAGNDDRLSSIRRVWRGMQKRKAELTVLEETLAGAEADQDYGSAQFRELDAAALKPGELEELETEQKSLANASDVKALLGACGDIFEPSDESSGLNSSLKELKRNLEKLDRFLPAAGELAARVESASIELDDIYGEISSLNEGVDLSPSRLEAVEERLSVLYSLMKKHSCRTVEELVEVRDRYAASAADTEELRERIACLRSEIGSMTVEYDALASELNAARTGASPAFASEILASLAFLELEKSVFEVRISPEKASETGTDAVDFMFSANGTRPETLSKCASGGEMSRIMLCLKAMMARFFGMPTMIFDEIDTGVSGSVADRMGTMICAMGRDMQVFSITHLPQVAAKGEAHYVVSKQETDGRTVSTIRKISGRDRVMEIARLLSGSRVTDAAIANAESLLGGC